MYLYSLHQTPKAITPLTYIHSYITGFYFKQLKLQHHSFPLKKLWPSANLRFHEEEHDIFMNVYKNLIFHRESINTVEPKPSQLICSFQIHFHQMLYVSSCNKMLPNTHAWHSFLANHISFTICIPLCISISQISLKCPSF